MAASSPRGLGAVAGNVYNVWHRFKGGKGLGISGGVILGLWPAVFPFVVVTLVIASALTRSTGIGSLVTLGALFVGAFAWESTGLDNPWGLAEPALLVVHGDRHRADHRPEALAGCPPPRQLTRPSVISNRIVTGPELTSSTSIDAPNTPVST